MMCRNATQTQALQSIVLRRLGGLQLYTVAQHGGGEDEGGEGEVRGGRQEEGAPRPERPPSHSKTTPPTK